MIYWLVAAAIATSGCTAPEDVVRGAVVVGQAASLDASAQGAGVNSAGGDSSVQYCEYFLPQENGDTRVLYYTPEGQKIAEKHLSFSVATESVSVPDEARPTVQQEDFRHGEIREVLREGDDFRMRYRKNAEARWQEKVVPMASVDVVDAGFDPFVRRHLSQLVSGNEVEFDFASPVHGQVVRLRARAVGCGDAVDATTYLCLEVDLAQPWLRWLAGDLQLVYSLDQRRLHHFQGVVNLLSERGSAQKMSIRYIYP